MTRRSSGRRARCVIAVAMALVVAACGSEGAGPNSSVSDAQSASNAPGRPSSETSGASRDGTGSGSGSGAGPRGDVTGSLPGDTSDKPSGTGPLASGGSHGPIQVGLLYVVNDGAASAGIDNGDTITTSDVLRAFVRSYNATGGLGGRRIEPVYAELHSASNNYESQIQSACAAFTQDNHVAVVLSNLGYYSETLLTCLSRASVPIFTGDWVGPDRQDAKRFPLLITPAALLGERRVAVVVKHMTAAGFLQSRNRIGVVIEDCPVNQRVYKNGLAPALRGAGLTVAWTYNTRCFRSLQDYAEQTSQMSSAVLQFRQHQVDRVMFVSQGAEANITFAFSTVAESQGWHPSYAVSSTALPSGLSLNMAKEQLVNVRGVGWLPGVDTEDFKQAPPTTTARRCLDRMKSLGIQPASNTDYTNIYGPCDSFSLYDAVLRAANGDPAASTVLRALSKVVTSYVSASTVGGRVAMSEGRISAASGRLFAYVRNTRFEYTSVPFPL